MAEKWIFWGKASQKPLRTALFLVIWTTFFSDLINISSSIAKYKGIVKMKRSNRVKRVSRKRQGIPLVLMIAFITVFSFNVLAVSQEEKWQIETFNISTLSGIQAVQAVVIFNTIDSDFSVGNLTKSQLQTQVELALRKAGIRVLEECDFEQNPDTGQLVVTVSVNRILLPLNDTPLYAVGSHVYFRQLVCLNRNHSIYALSQTWPFLTIPEPMIVGSYYVENSIKERVQLYVSRFINDYLAAQSVSTTSEQQVDDTLNLLKEEIETKKEYDDQNPAEKVGKIEAISCSGEKPCIMFSGEILYEGDYANGFKIVKIHKDRVEFEKDGKVIVQGL